MQRLVGAHSGGRVSGVAARVVEGRDSASGEPIQSEEWSRWRHVDRLLVIYNPPG
jgi:hypothetical protein